MNPYRRRVVESMRELLAPHAPVASALDYGAGDGWFAHVLEAEGIASRVVPVDVQARKRHYVRPQLYDGRRLPFPDRSFDLSYSVDVLHHCPDPLGSLRELVRCTGKLLLVKDHTYRSLAGWLTLCALDEIGNRRFGIPSRYLYQRGWDWLPLLQQAGFELEELVHPVRCHSGILGWATNGLQFLGLWRRNES